MTASHGADRGAGSAGPLSVSGFNGLRSLDGQSLPVPAPVQVTQQAIEDFCRAVGNDEWIHWDVTRCRAMPWGNTIAPSAMVVAWFPRLLHAVLRVDDPPNSLFVGADRLRLLRPLVCGSRFTQRVTVSGVEEKPRGLNLLFDTAWHLIDDAQPFAVATFIIRYLSD